MTAVQVGLVNNQVKIGAIPSPSSRWKRNKIPKMISVNFSLDGKLTLNNLLKKRIGQQITFRYNLAERWLRPRNDAQGLEQETHDYTEEIYRTAKKVSPNKKIDRRTLYSWDINDLEPGASHYKIPDEIIEFLKKSKTHILRIDIIMKKFKDHVLYFSAGEIGN